MLRNAVATMGFKLVSFTTNIDTSGPNSFSDEVVLSAAVIVSFHYCGGNTNMGKVVLAIRGAGAYCALDVVWVGNTCTGMVTNRRTHANWTRQKTT